MNRRCLNAVALLVVLLAAAQAEAQTFDSTPTTVIFYKNGLAWVTEEGRTKPDREWLETKVHSVPVMGTLKVAPKGDVRVAEMKAMPGDQAAAFQVLEALASRTTGERIFVQALGRNLSGEFLGLSHGGLSTEPMLVLQAKDGTIFIPVSRIEQISTNLTTGQLDLETHQPETGLRLRLSARRDEVHIISSYLTRGLGWIPSYQLKLKDRDKGELAMNAVVVNNALDLLSVSMQFATGEAAFPLRHVDSPLFFSGTTPEQVMDLIMGHVRGGVDMLDFDNNPVYNTMNYMPAQQMVSAGPGMDQPRSSGEETHLYGPQTLSLKRGERATVPLGRREVPAKFVYLWKAPQNISEQTEQNTVWLTAQIVNKLPFPLTTGGVLVTRNGRPVGQGFVTYTHKGGEALVPISIASSVVARAGEQEVDREKSAARFRGLRYDKVVVKGTLHVENLQNHPVTVRIEKPVTGRVKKTSHGGTSVEQFVSAYDPNPRTDITWTLDVKAGEQAKIEYRYEYLVQRHEKWSS